MTYSLGIDIGTTYTAAAVVRDGRPAVVSLSYRSASIPTVVVLAEDGTFLVGEAAERRGWGTPERLVREFKRRVGDPTPVLLGGTPVSIDRLLAEVIGLVHGTVAAVEGAPPISTVVTHPANWGPFKRDVLVQALRLADVDGATLLPEPVAAATWYAGAERLAPGATVAVYDLGGGTFDTAVLEMGPDRTFAVRGQPEGIERLGGIDVDAAVLGHVLRVLGPAADGLDPDDDGTMVAMAQLRRECVEAKEALSDETSVTIPVLLPARRDQVLLQRRELEELVGPLLAPTTAALARAVASAGLGPGQPDAVLLVGGASRMPLVAREVTAALGRPVAVDAHPKHPVALGAAIVAAARATAAVPGVVGVPGAGTPNGRPAAAVAGAGSAVAGAPGRGAPPVPPGTPSWPGRQPSPPLGVAPAASHRRSRRRVLAALATIAAVVVAAVTVVRLGGGDDDPSPGGHTPRDGAPARGGAPARLLWHVGIGQRTAAGPATDGRHVFVLDKTDRLSAIDAATGKVAWRVQVAGAPGRADDPVTAPVVAGDLVLASETGDFQVHAYDADLGTQRWTSDAAFFTEPPVVVDGALVISEGSKATALELADGSVRWQSRAPADAFAMETGFYRSGRAVVAGTGDGQIMAFDAHTGEYHYQVRVPPPDDEPEIHLPVDSMATVGDYAIVNNSSLGMSGLSVQTGTVAWSNDVGAGHPPATLAVGNYVAVPLDGGDVGIIDVVDGVEHARVPAAPGVLGVVPGRAPLLLVAGGGTLRAFGVDGKRAWSTPGLPFEPATMAVAAGVAVVADGDGHLAGYRLPA